MQSEARQEGPHLLLPAAHCGQTLRMTATSPVQLTSARSEKSPGVERLPIHKCAAGCHLMVDLNTVKLYNVLLSPRSSKVHNIEILADRLRASCANECGVRKCQLATALRVLAGTGNAAVAMWSADRHLAYASARVPLPLLLASFGCSPKCCGLPALQGQCWCLPHVLPFAEACMTT